MLIVDFVGVVRGFRGPTPLGPTQTGLFKVGWVWSSPSLYIYSIAKEADQKLRTIF